MRVSRSVLLPAPPPVVWSMLLDWERQAEWMRDADRVDVRSTHREGLGVVVAVKTRVFNIPFFTERLEVVGWSPPTLVVMAHRGGIGGRGEWLLEPDPAGTRFTWTEDLHIRVPVIGELALAVYRPFMRWLMAGAMEDLGAFVQREGGAYGVEAV
jgi:Polyketide cyclase / dehydrase and lipid transport